MFPAPSSTIFDFSAVAHVKSVFNNVFTPLMKASISSMKHTYMLGDELSSSLTNKRARRSSNFFFTEGKAVVSLPRVFFFAKDAIR